MKPRSTRWYQQSKADKKLNLALDSHSQHRQTVSHVFNKLDLLVSFLVFFVWRRLNSRRCFLYSSRADFLLSNIIIVCFCASWLSRISDRCSLLNCWRVCCLFSRPFCERRSVWIWHDRFDLHSTSMYRSQWSQEQERQRRVGWFVDRSRPRAKPQWRYLHFVDHMRRTNESPGEWYWEEQESDLIFVFGTTTYTVLTNQISQAKRRRKFFVNEFALSTLFVVDRDFDEYRTSPISERKTFLYGKGLR